MVGNRTTVSFIVVPVRPNLRPRQAPQNCLSAQFRLLQLIKTALEVVLIEGRGRNQEARCSNSRRTSARHQPPGDGARALRHSESEAQSHFDTEITWHRNSDGQKVRALSRKSRTRDC